MTPLSHHLQRADIQAILRSGFGSMRHVRYLLLAVAQPEAARAWLNNLVTSRLVLSAAQVGSGAPRVKIFSSSDAFGWNFRRSFRLSD